MPLPDLREFFDPSLTLPIGGTDYAIPAAQLDQARRLRRSVLAGMSETEELAEIDELFGPALVEQMCADGVRWTEYLHAGRTALLWIATNAEIAAAHWKLAQLGELVDLDKLSALIAENERARATEKPAAPKPAKSAPKRGARRRTTPAKA